MRRAAGLFGLTTCRQSGNRPDGEVLLKSHEHGDPHLRDDPSKVVQLFAPDHRKGPPEQHPQLGAHRASELAFVAVPPLARPGIVLFAVLFAVANDGVAGVLGRVLFELQRERIDALVRRNLVK